jgi:hypothetical protein
MTCARANLNFSQIVATRSGADEDPGSNAEWHITVHVEGGGSNQSFTIVDEYVKDNKVIGINRDVLVDIINSNTTIGVFASGYEEDDSRRTTNCQHPISTSEVFKIGESVRASHLPDPTTNLNTLLLSRSAASRRDLKLSQTRTVTRAFGSQVPTSSS